jgi:hypothetical protein
LVTLIFKFQMILSNEFLYLALSLRISNDLDDDAALGQQ